MIVKALNTDLVRAHEKSIEDILNQYLTDLSEKSVLVITSKIVSLCEGRVVKIGKVDKDQLVKEEAEMIIDEVDDMYGGTFTITNRTLIRSAGIDESNGDGYYVLWPKDSTATANQIRRYLKKRFRLAEVGVLIIDSISIPLRLGTIGITLGFSGFKPLNDYRGQTDLFGRPIIYSRAGVANGLAASASLVMGEGSEKTPICVISEVPFVEFSHHDPSKEDLEYLNMPIDEDIFAPFIKGVRWREGEARSD